MKRFCFLILCMSISLSAEELLMAILAFDKTLQTWTNKIESELVSMPKTQEIENPQFRAIIEQSQNALRTKYKGDITLLEKDIRDDLQRLEAINYDALAKKEFRNQQKDEKAVENRLQKVYQSLQIYKDIPKHNEQALIDFNGKYKAEQERYDSYRNRTAPEWE